MKLSVQKRLAADVLKCSPKRVHLAADRSADIKEAITRADIKGLVGEGIIVKKQATGVSRVRAKHRANQRRKGLQRGPGKKKGKKTALVPKKTSWMVKIRTQRTFLQELKSKNLLNQEDYVALYKKSKGGFFRNKRHIKVYIEEHDMVQKK
ncbi:MAG: 50S ribosomal protein L19e [Candidatus Nanoarchaeia archaeon]